MKPTLDRSPTPEAVLQAEGLGCAFIMLGHGKFALLDKSDLERFSNWTWHFNRKGYAARLQYRGPDRCDSIVYLHRAIMDEPEGLVDHRNRNKLDCRKENLRIATKRQNNGNMGKRQQVNGASSRFKGVCFDNGKKRWLAQGRDNSRMVFIGRFTNETDAARAYNAWASQHFGEFAFLNPV